MVATAMKLAFDGTADQGFMLVPGAAVMVRNRRAVVVEVDPFEMSEDQTRRLVRVVYGDGQSPVSEHILWGIEGELMLPGQGLRLAPGAADLRLFRALLQTRKWSTGPPFPGMEQPGGGPRHIPIAPLYAGVRPLPHQLVPLERALAQPNVRLLLADDVGLGKTIEAGLIMTELLVRRRIHRILVLAPPGLREQWQRELWQRFSLDFRIVDGPENRRLKKELGESCCPWSLYPRIITSPHYLRSSGTLQAFMEGCAAPARPHAPWDLLVVDEAHHLAPRAKGTETLLTQMLRTVAPWFEHRVFLTATPHDGYSATYTGLLEILDPVRFRKTAAPTPAERRRQRQVVIRRTRRSVAGRSAPTATAEPIPVQLHPAEQEVLERFRLLRERVLRWGLDAGGERQSGALLSMEVLARRMLSSWAAFHASFDAFRKGLHAGLDVQTLPSGLMPAAGTEAAEPAWSRLTLRLGGWLARYYPHQLGAFDDLGASISRLGPGSVDGIDSRRDAWIDWLRREVHGPQKDERAVVFTEYVATLDALTRAVNGHLPELNGRVAAVHGQTGGALRRDALSRFSSPADGLTVLLCTDVLAEGLNLHQRARLVFHYDLPWNPAVLQQRVGRLDRLGQRRPVRSFHFRSSEVEEMRLHRRLESKVARISGDIGPTVPLLSPLPQTGVHAAPSLFRVPATPAEERGPAVCARTGPLRETRAGLAVQEDALGATPASLQTAVADILRSSVPSPALLQPRRNVLEVHGGNGLGAALAALTAGPVGPVGPVGPRMQSAVLDFCGDFPEVQSDLAVARIHPGHPLLGWLLARHGRTVSVPWLALAADGVESLSPGLLIFALESAAAEGNPLLHQALLPLWLPLLQPGENPQVGPLEPATRRIVNSVLTGAVELHAGPGQRSRDELAQLAAQRLRLFAKQRNSRLEAALADHCSATLTLLRGARRHRSKELAACLEKGPAEELIRLESRQRAGVLFPELASELESRRVELRRELARITARRARLLTAIEQEAHLANQTLANRHRLIAPLTLCCEGLVYVWPGGRDAA